MSKVCLQLTILHQAKAISHRTKKIHITTLLDSIFNTVAAESSMKTWNF